MQFLTCITLLLLVSACMATLKGGLGVGLGLGGGLVGGGIGKWYLILYFVLVSPCIIKKTTGNGIFELENTFVTCYLK